MCGFPFITEFCKIPWNQLGELCSLNLVLFTLWLKQTLLTPLSPSLCFHMGWNDLLCPFTNIQHQTSSTCELQKQKQILCPVVSSFSSWSLSLLCTLYRIVAVPSGTVLNCLMLCNVDNVLSHYRKLLAERKEPKNKSCISGTSFSEIRFLW